MWNPKNTNTTAHFIPPRQISRLHAKPEKFEKLHFLIKRKLKLGSVDKRTFLQRNKQLSVTDARDWWSLAV
jgi:hypothetical protein